MVTEITHAVNTQKDCVDESSLDCCTLVPTALQKRHGSKHTGPLLLRKGCNKMALWMPSQLLLSDILLVRDQLQPEQPLRMNPILPQ